MTHRIFLRNFLPVLRLGGVLLVSAPREDFQRDVLSNIWVNGNFKAFQKDFQHLEHDAVLITNWRGKGKIFGKLNVKKHYVVSDDCIKFYENDCENLIRQIIAEVGHEKNLLYVVSAGPLSNVIITALFKNNPENCYVDFGSSTDFVTHGKINRGYVREGSPTSEKNCWMFDKKKINLDIDVVLTCYKRPQILAQQLEAIKNQTLAPRRIFLYQDGIDGYYKIELNDKILSEFDACKISSTNGGVWKRFEFAEEIAKSPYVCLFDDDTIPGNRWFENCHMNMIQNRGVYGTNAILVKNFKDYRDGRLWAGWTTANNKTCAVDFVGHSWFIEREYLSWMIAKPWRKKYKTVGEDMTISAAAAEHGFGTYAPQHPLQILSLWGSLPKFGSKYGATDVAISSNPSSPNKMREAFNEIHANGWKCLLEKNPDYIEEFLSAFGKRRIPPDRNIVEPMINLSTNLLMPLIMRKPSIFFGERKYFAPVHKLFNLPPTYYKILEDEKNQVYFEKLFSSMRRNAIHVFFFDGYEELIPYFEKIGLRENVDFADGRWLLVAMTN